MSGPHAAILPDGRLHLQHGPIDLVVEAVSRDPSASPLRGGRTRPQAEPGGGGGAANSEARGGTTPTPVLRFAPARPSPQGGGRALPDSSLALVYDAAAARFATILSELCGELSELRRPAGGSPCRLRGRIARRMHAAVAPFAADAFITPMAAVAGAVAEEVLAAMVAAAPLRRASVNNGGDIALHLAPGEHVRVGLVDRPDRPGLFGAASVRHGDGIGGVATSGWRGRSFSLGIADAVTILARKAAEADAAATVVANAVDLPGHPAVTRVPARDVQCDSDLGERLVTRGVGPLAPAEIATALARGLAEAEALVARGLIAGAALHLQGTTAATHLFSPRAGRSRVARQGDRMRGQGDSTSPACLLGPSSGRRDRRLDLSPRRGERRQEVHA